MKRFQRSVGWKVLLWGCLIPFICESTWASGQVFDLPGELMENIFFYLSPSELAGVRLNRAMDQGYRQASESFQRRFTRIERLLELDSFIQLPFRGRKRKRRAMSPIGVSQELWVEVMSHNPSFFKEKRYCPKTFKFKKIYRNNGKMKKIPMCADFPVDSVNARGFRKKESYRKSDEEFLRRLNAAFEIAGRGLRFRRATPQEYVWADTEGGKNPKRWGDPGVWNYTTYLGISDRAPLDLDKRSASGLPQPHGVKAKLPNGLGFYRSGVKEWTTESRQRLRTVMGGGSWGGTPEKIEGYSEPVFVGEKSPSIGASRLVVIY